MNETLRRHFEPIIPDEGLRAKKSNIRSFAWSPPLKVSSPDSDSLGAEHRWGIHLLSVTNDDNDVILLRVQRTEEQSYSIEMLSLTSLHDLVGNFPIGQPSILSSAIKHRLKTSSMSYGPWVYEEVGEGEWFATANVALVYGTKLKIVKQRIQLNVSSAGCAIGGQLSSSCEANSPLHIKEMDNFQFRGPLQWIYTVCIGTLKIYSSLRNAIGEIPRDPSSCGNNGRDDPVNIDARCVQWNGYKTTAG